MHLDHVISASKHIGWVSFHRPATLEDVARALRDLEADPTFQPEYGLLVDLRELGDRPTGPEVHHLAETLGTLPYTAGRKVAMVLSGRRALACARIAAFCAEYHGFQISPFSDLGSAERWLCEHGYSKPPPVIHRSVAPRLPARIAHRRAAGSPR